MKYLKTRINKIIIAVLFCILPAGGLTACKGPAAPPAETDTQILSESIAAETSGTQENSSPEYLALTPEQNTPSSDASSENLPYDSETIIEEQSFSGMDLESTGMSVSRPAWLRATACRISDTLSPQVKRPFIPSLMPMRPGILKIPLILLPSMTSMATAKKTSSQANNTQPVPAMKTPVPFPWSVFT